MADQHITQNPHSSSAPQPNRIKNFDKQFPLLRSTYKNSLKLSISNSKELDLVRKKQKILEKELQNIKISDRASKKYKKKIDKIQCENLKQKFLLVNDKELKKKEIEKKQTKVKDLRDKECNSINQIKNHRIMHSKILSIERNEMKKKFLEDLSKEKDKINEENRKKKEFIKKLDEDILKRKNENEKIKNKIKLEKIEQETKLLEELNKKLSKKINKYKNINLDIAKKIVQKKYGVEVIYYKFQ
jgi:hypothetical protein